MFVTLLVITVPFVLTEIVLVNIYQEDYAIMIGYNMTPEADILWLRKELEIYSFDFGSIYENFSSTSSSESSERYRKLIRNGTQVLIYTLTIFSINSILNE